MHESDALDDGIRDDDLTSFRNLLQKLLAADNGVFSGTDDGMVSYSAGSKYFITSPALYEDAGEFVGSLINKYCPKLCKHIKDILDNENDPISILFEPVAETDTKALASDHLDEVAIFNTPNCRIVDFTQGLSDAGNCLYKHLRSHPNQLTQLAYSIFSASISLLDIWHPWNLSIVEETNAPSCWTFLTRLPAVLHALR